MPHFAGHIGGDLDADGVGEAASAELFLYDLQQIFWVFDIGFDFGIPRDTEMLMLDDLHAGEKGFETGLDQAFDGHEDVFEARAAAGADGGGFIGFLEGQPAGQALRDFDAGKQMLAGGAARDTDSAGLTEQDADGERDWK